MISQFLQLNRLRDTIRDNAPEAFLVAVRLIIFCMACMLPIKSPIGEKISPISFQSEATDMGVYLLWSERYFDWSAENIQWMKRSYIEVVNLENGSFTLPGPVFPLLIKATGYAPGMTMPLALLFLCLSIVYGITWLRWFKRKGTPSWSHWLFALVPNPIWFTLVLSTDLLFSAFFVAFFLTYVESDNQKNDKWALFWLFCSVMSRPNALTLIGFIIIDRLLLRPRKTTVPILLGFAAICTVSLAFYLPYFIFMFFLSDAGEQLTYFGYSSAEHIKGLYPSLHTMLDQTLSIARLFGAKILYFFGLRPSYSDTHLLLVLIRGAVGVFMIPGLILYLKREDWPRKVFVVSFIMPFILMASQDRYHLPIMPLLFFYGTLWYAKLIPPKKRLSQT